MARHGDGLSGQEQVPCGDEPQALERVPLKENVTVLEGDAVSAQLPAALTPELKQDIAGSKSTLPNSRGGAGALAEDALVHLTTRGVKRESLQLRDGDVVLKRQCATVVEELQETVAQAVLKAGEEWNATNLAIIKSMQEEFLEQIDAGKRREALVLEEREDLIIKLDAQKKMAALLLEERKKLISKIHAQEEMEAVLLHEHQKVLDEFFAEKEKFLQLLQESKQKVDHQMKIETVLTQERQELIKEIRARKRREKAFLLERQEFLNKTRDSSSKSTGSNLSHTTKLLYDVTQKLFALAKEVEESQRVDNFEGDKSACDPRATPCLEMPTTVASSVAEAEKMINRAKEALTEAAERWKKNQDGVKRMISCYRGDISDRILGRTKPAFRDIPDETQTIEQQRQVEQKALELKESEQMRVPRTRMKPQRFRTSP